MSKAEKTRQYIVETTAPIFNRKGYAGTSIADITEATGLTKGSIYGNFAGKDEVALAAFEYNLSLVDSTVRREMACYHTCKEKLLVYTYVYDHFKQYPFSLGGCPILNTAVEADDTHPALRQRAIDAINFWKSKIIRLIEKGVENGEFRPGVNAEETALTLIAMIEGAIMISHLTGKSLYRKSVMKAAEKLISDLE